MLWELHRADGRRRPAGAVLRRAGHLRRGAVFVTLFPRLAGRPRLPRRGARWSSPAAGGGSAGWSAAWATWAARCARDPAETEPSGMIVAVAGDRRGRHGCRRLFRRAHGGRSAPLGPGQPGQDLLGRGKPRAGRPPRSSGCRSASGRGSARSRRCSSASVPASPRRPATCSNRRSSAGSGSRTRAISSPPRRGDGPARRLDGRGLAAGDLAAFSAWIVGITLLAMRRRVSIFGATGSVGRNTVSVLSKRRAGRCR